MKIATSDTHPLYVNWLWPPDDPAHQGGLGLTIAPGKQGPGLTAYWKRDLETDLARLKELGVTVLAPLLTDEELETLGISGYVDAARSQGLEVLRFPFPDGGVPEGHAELDGFLVRLAARLHADEAVVVHCRGGLGRAGLVCACLLLHLGECRTGPDAVARIRGTRSARAVETREQERFVDEHADFISSRGRAG